MVTSDQSIWNELDVDSKAFEIDIKPFDIENQIGSTRQDSPQAHHIPYDWNESIEQEVKQEKWNRTSMMIYTQTINCN